MLDTFALLAVKTHCCTRMAEAITSSCELHPDRFDCPDALIHYSPRSRGYGIIVHDGGNSFVTIGELTRSLTKRAERAKLKSHRDDMIIAQGKQSAALGGGPNMIFSFFFRLARRARQPEEKREWNGWRFTQGGGLGGLALGYYHAAPAGAPESEPTGCRQGRDRASANNRTSLARPA